MSRFISKRKWRGILFVLLLLPAWAQAAVPVFELSKPGSPTHYLVGTIHIEVDGLEQVRQVAGSLLPKVETLALELVPDATAMAQILGSIMRSMPVDPADRLNAAQLEALRQEMDARGVPAQALPMFKPWLLAVMISLPKELGQGLDLWLHARAEDAGVSVVGLETAQEQLGALDGLPEDQQWSYLAHVLDNLRSLPKLTQDLTSAYASGDLRALDAWNAQEEARMPATMRDWYRRVLILDRNRRMWVRLQPHLQRGSTMVAVGALHLVGESGLLAQFRAAGYGVRQR